MDNMETAGLPQGIVLSHCTVLPSLVSERTSYGSGDRDRSYGGGGGGGSWSRGGGGEGRGGCSYGGGGGGGGRSWGDRSAGGDRSGKDELFTYSLLATHEHTHTRHIHHRNAH